MALLNTYKSNGMLISTRENQVVLFLIPGALSPHLSPHHLHFDLHRVKPQKMVPPTDSWAVVPQPQCLHE